MTYKYSPPTGHASRRDVSESATMTTTEAPYIPGLTRVEALIFDRLRRANGEIVSYEDIARATWGYMVERPAIAVNVKRIRIKLGHDVITTVSNYGYRLGAAPEPCEHCLGTGIRRPTEQEEQA